MQHTVLSIKAQPPHAGGALPLGDRNGRQATAVATAVAAAELAEILLGSRVLACCCPRITICSLCDSEAGTHFSPLSLLPPCCQWIMWVRWGGGGTDRKANVWLNLKLTQGRAKLYHGAYS